MGLARYVASIGAGPAAIGWPRVLFDVFDNSGTIFHKVSKRLKQLKFEFSPEKSMIKG
jgi:hypothetical protein